MTVAISFWPRFPAFSRFLARSAKAARRGSLPNLHSRSVMRATTASETRSSSSSILSVAIGSIPSCRSERRSRACSLDTLDDAQVALAALAERVEGLAIVGAVMGGNSLCDALEFDDDGALREAVLVGLDRNTPSEKAAAVPGDRGSCEFGVSRERVGIGYRAIAADPVTLGHSLLPYCLAGQA